jgi:hypothetical protein
MNDEFKKIDQLMARNVPAESERIRNKRIDFKTNQTWIGVVTALSISCIIAVSIISNQRRDLENALVLSETLEWDVTTDENPEEFESPLLDSFEE